MPIEREFNAWVGLLLVIEETDLAFLEPKQRLAVEVEGFLLDAGRGGVPFSSTTSV